MDARALASCHVSRLRRCYAAEAGWKRLTKLKEFRAADKEQLAQLATDVENLVRVVNQLTLENRQLRQQLATPGRIVRLLPAQPQPPGR